MSKLLNISLFVFLFLTPNHFSENDKIQKKILRANGFDIECYVSLKKKDNFDEDKLYYWFKSGEIHTSIASAGGNVLHSKYSKFYRSNQLAEQGTFKYGLKNGIWKTWNEDGSLNQTIEWKRGYKNGDFRNYDVLGKLIEKGTYKKDKKNGTWLNLVTKDTLKYKNGEKLILDKKTKKQNFFKRFFKKKTPTKDSKKVKKSKEKSTKKSKKTKTKKES